MLIVDRPYVSGLLRETLLKNRFPVLQTIDAQALLPEKGINFITSEMAIAQIKTGEIKTIYTSSENSIGWIYENLNFTRLPEKVNFFKNKAKFRHLLSDIYPDFFFKEISLEELENLKTNGLPFPFIIKPNIGFFSLGVHKVSSPGSWKTVKSKIQTEIEVIKNTYPKEVLDTTGFIIEEVIGGEEFTIDVFYNSDGQPVILGMMHHIFAHSEDTSDRLYTTSPQIIAEKLEPFTEFLQMLGNRMELRNFPLHIEVRVDENGKIMPIEGNPLRYGGWCTSAELTHFAFGINPYECVMKNISPDWNEILKAHSGNSFSIIILNNNSGFDARKIRSFDYAALVSKLEKVLELRKADVQQFHIFGFVYAETRPENFKELEALLQSDLREFIQISGC